MLFVLVLFCLRATVMTMKNQGYILIGFIVMIFIVATTTTLYFSQRFGESKVLYRRTAYKASQQNLELSIAATLKSQRGWTNTVNSSLNKVGGANLSSCMNDVTYNCPAGNFPFSVVDDSGQVLVDSSVPQNGLNGNFSACTTYGTSNASDCFMRYSMTWTPECPATGPCTSPPILVKGKLIIDPFASSEINIKEEPEFQFHLR